MSYFSLIITFVLLNNVALIQCLGLCPAIRPPKTPLASIGMGSAVVFAMTGTVLVTTLVNRFLLAPLHLQSLQILVFVFTTLGVVWLVDRSLLRLFPALRVSLGAYAPTVSVNCAVAGIAFLCVKESFTIPESLLAAGAAGIGYTLALLLLSTIREKLETEKVPPALRGAPIIFISAGLLALGIMALDVSWLRFLFG